MNSQELEQERLPLVAQSIFYVTEERVENGLLLLLQRLPDYFQERAKRADVDTAVFCLHRLFTCVDTLYQQTLPTLMQQETMPPPSRSLTHRYHRWEQLQAILLLLERIESHCHLLLSAVSSLLTVLNTAEDASISQERTHVGSEQWQRAYELLSQTLHSWQERQSTRTTFASLFIDSTFPHLATIDTAFALLFDSANAIFGDIVPDIQLIAQGDDEVAATLLFDLMQQSDLVLIQISKLVEPLGTLTKSFSVKE